MSRDQTMDIEAAAAAVQDAPAGRSLTARAMLQFRRDRGSMIAAHILGFLVVCALLLPFVWPHDPGGVNWYAIEQPPSATHWFGTDSVGRDLFVRIMIGLRVSLALGLMATAVAVLIGITYGAVAGLAGGRVDAIMMRIVDVLYALPFLFIVVLLMVVFGRHVWLIFIGVGAVEWLTLARIVRGQTLYLKNREFVEAARAIGVSPRRMLVRHIVPNLLGVVAVYATLAVPQVILIESFLSFLGLGVQEPLSSLGVLIKDGMDTLEITPWQLIFPAIILSILLLALNTVGDGLRDALDPRSSRGGGA